MEQLPNIQMQRKIYTENSMWLVAFLGGPLSAGYIIAENFKTFNETGKVKITWSITIAVTILIFGSIFALPETIIDKIPNQFIPIIYTAVAAVIISHYQKTKIIDYFAEGGEKHSWWRATFVGFIGLLVTLLFVVITAFIAGGFSGESLNLLNSKTYGELHHEIFYDKNNILENEIDKIANGLTEAMFFDEAFPKEVVVEKINDNYELTISVVENAINDEEVLSHFTGLKIELQNYFPNNKIVIKLTPDYYGNVVKRLE
jgi:hypothetical protein